MKVRKPTGTPLALIAVAMGTLLFASRRSSAQIVDLAPPSEQPAWSLNRPHLQEVTLNLEAERENFTSKDGARFDSSRIYVSPAVGIGWSSFIYHPYLFNYSILAEPGYVYESRTLNGRTTSDQVFVVNGTATATVLEVKPYATTVSYNRSHEEVKYDFFNTAMVDMEGFGVTTGYREGPMPFTVSFSKTKEDSTQFDQRAVTDQTLVNLSGRNEREDRNATDVAYQYNQFDRTTDLANTSYRTENTYQHVAVNDIEHFEHSFLNTSVRFNDRESQTASESDVSLNADYEVTHPHNLNSYYTYTFSEFSGNGYDSYQNYAIAGLGHQLFESLATSAEIHGSTLDTTSFGTKVDQFSAGTTLSANYTKHIGSWGTINIYNSTGYNYTEQDASSSTLVIPNEAYKVPPNGLIRLNQAREISVTSVTDAANNPLQQGLDYAIIQATDPWQIQIINTGPAHVQAGSTVLVTYTVRPNPSGHYGVAGNQFEIRLSLWADRAAIYARYHVSQSHASSRDFLVQDDETIETGVEYNWRNLRLSAEYINTHSTLYDFVSYDLTESYSVAAFGDSQVGIDLLQQWTEGSYQTGGSTNLNDRMTFFSYMLHYQYRPLPTLDWTVEVGYRQQRGLGLDQDVFAARTYVNWSMGKLQLHCGYEHGFQNFRNDNEDRDYGFIKLRRMF